MNASASQPTLATLGHGESAHIAHFTTFGPVERRLMALGFIPGAQVSVVRRAPLRDPIEYEVLGARVSLRASEAARIPLLRADIAGAA